MEATPCSPHSHCALRARERRRRHPPLLVVGCAPDSGGDDALAPSPLSLWVACQTVEATTPSPLLVVCRAPDCGGDVPLPEKQSDSAFRSSGASFETESSRAPMTHEMRCTFPRAELQHCPHSKRFFPKQFISLGALFGCRFADKLPYSRHRQYLKCGSPPDRFPRNRFTLAIADRSNPAA